MVLLVISRKAAFELVKDAIVLIQRTQLGSEIVVHLVRLDWSIRHIHIPHWKIKNKISNRPNISDDTMITTQPVTFSSPMTTGENYLASNFGS